jgi:hypothetical protein
MLALLVIVAVSLSQVLLGMIVSTSCLPCLQYRVHACYSRKKLYLFAIFKRLGINVIRPFLTVQLFALFMRLSIYM